MVALWLAWWASPIVVTIGWLSGCGGPPPPPAPVSPILPAIPAETAAASVAAARPSTPEDPRCEPTMFPDAPTGDLRVFEDAAGRYGFRDGTGRIVVPARFHHLYELNVHGIAGGVAADPVRFVFVDRTGAVVARAYPYDNGPDYFVAGRARIVDDAGRVGFLAETGEIVIDPQFGFATSFCRGRAVACVGCVARNGPAEHDESIEGGRWGVIGWDGGAVIPFRYDAIEALESGQFRVVLGGREQTLDRDGEPVR